MSGYVASARIAHVAPRIASAERATAPADDRPAATAAVVVETDGPARGGASRVTERWTATRERVSQMTFFLFDPNSWR